MMLAANQNRIECVETLLRFETKICSSAGLTALMIASKKGNVEIVKLLINEESRMQTTEDHFGFVAGSTALMMAKYYGRDEVVALLVPTEGDLKNRNGQTYEEIQHLDYQSIMSASVTSRSNSRLRSDLSASRFRGDMSSIVN